MTTITFERFGGFLEPPIDFTLDLDTLPTREARYLLHLLDETDFFHLPVDLIGAPVGDEFIYTITVEANISLHRVHISEMSLPGTLLQPLIDVLSAVAPVP